MDPLKVGIYLVILVSSTGELFNNLRRARMFKTFVKIFFGLLAIVAVVTVFRMLSLSITTPAKLVEKTMDADNIIHNYEWFYDVQAAYMARVDQVNQYKGFLSAETDKDEQRRLRIEQSAMQQTCRDLVQKYNANSQKLNTKIFKGWSLPQYLDTNNCE